MTNAYWMRVHIICLVSGLIASLFAARFASAQQLTPGQVRTSAAVALLQADTSTATDEQVQAEYKLSKNHLLYAGGEQLSRVYPGNVLLTDRSADIGHVSSLSARWYLEDRVQVAPNATFLPLWQAQTIPHYILKNGQELSLQLRYSHYSGQDVTSVSPGWFWAVRDNLVLSLQLNIIETWHTILSEQAYIQYAFDARHRIRLTGATGRAVEGNNLEGDFTAVALGYKWISLWRLDLEPNVSVYRGSVRNEEALGMTVGWTFR